MVGDDTGVATECVYFAYDLSFSDTAHGWIAAHLCDGLHIHSGKQDFAAHICCSYRCFAAGVAGANNNYIVFLKHKAAKIRFWPEIYGSKQQMELVKQGQMV